VRQNLCPSGNILTNQNTSLLPQHESFALIG
jgi:hypothetical protein